MFRVLGRGFDSRHLQLILLTLEEIFAEKKIFKNSHNAGVELKRSCNNAKAQALRKRSGAWMRRGVRRRSVGRKQDVSDRKATPATSIEGC